MQAASSVERAFDVPRRTRAAMVLLGFVPLLHASASVAPIVLVLFGRPGWWLALVPLALYLVPPLLVRLVTWRRPFATGLVDLSSPAFLQWWFTAQCQTVFARLPILEELLRLVPALYSAWLRLWGSKVGGLVYWAPGVSILDRALLDVGDRVAFGAGVRLNPHVIVPVPGRQRTALVLAPITIGSDALVGGYSTLLSGCVIAPGEVTPPFRSIHVYTLVEDGRRSRLPTMPVPEDLDAMAG
jgi:hypothetical protein